MPLARRLPKRGFTNIFRVEYQVVNVGQLGAFAAGSEIDPEHLRGKRLVRRKRRPVKVLGKGEITRALTVKVHAVSEAARRKIETAGGTVELIAAAKLPITICSLSPNDVATSICIPSTTAVSVPPPAAVPPGAASGPRRSCES